MTDTTQDDDFYPATAGDDPIWLGGVEYITKSRSDDLVKAERERCAEQAESHKPSASLLSERYWRGVDEAAHSIAVAIREGEE